MVSFDASLLNTDPATIATGGVPATTSEQKTAACEAAKASFRTALTFRILFEGLVFLFAAALLILLVVTIWTLFADVDRAVSIATGAGTIASTAGVAYLGRQRNRATKVEDDALAHVSTYCGAAVAQQLKG